jgi:hypothetical protein
MKKLFGAYLAAAIALLLSAGEAAAAEATPEQRAFYLACYRRVLAVPEFALMDSASLYRIRNEALARMVITACEDEIQPYGMQLIEAAFRAPRSPGATPPSADGGFIAWEAGLRQRVADDLVEAAPRVKPFADADPGDAQEQ